MTVIPSKEHPYWHARALINKYLGSIEGVEFSYYKYTPQSLIDTRLIFAVSALDFSNVECFKEIVRCCPLGYELAMHSKVRMVSGKDVHIPMVDMSTGSAAQLSKLKPVLGQEFGEFSWYKSGRSYHGYGEELISHDDWIVLMGKLLLANQIGMPPTVDPRWIGHRLIAGYAALRWTKNTPHYIDTPKRLVYFDGRS